MRGKHRKEIKSFAELRVRVRQLVEQHEEPLPPESADMVREFLAEVGQPEKQTGGE